MSKTGGLPHLEQVRRMFDGTKRVFVLTGAGISADSGIPTFRGPDGYWKKHRPEELASPEGFARDPKLVWEWYNYRRRVIAQAKPNVGHYAVAEMERRARNFLLCTQNVDGLHRLAGNSRIVEIHGSIWRLRPADGGEAFDDRRIFDDDELPPRTSNGRLLRPDVVWYGEIVPPGTFETVEGYLQSGIDLAFVIGTTAVIHYIYRWTRLLKHLGAIVIEANPTPELPDEVVTAHWTTRWPERLFPDLTA